MSPNKLGRCVLSVSCYRTRDQRLETTIPIPSLQSANSLIVWKCQTHRNRSIVIVYIGDDSSVCKNVVAAFVNDYTDVERVKRQPMPIIMENSSVTTSADVRRRINLGNFNLDFLNERHISRNPLKIDYSKRHPANIELWDVILLYYCQHTSQLKWR